MESEADSQMSQSDMYSNLNKASFIREQKQRFSPPLKMKNPKVIEETASQQQTSLKKDQKVIEYKNRLGAASPFASGIQESRSEMNQTTQTFNVDQEKNKIITKEEHRKQLL